MLPWFQDYDSLLFVNGQRCTVSSSMSSEGGNSKTLLQSLTFGHCTGCLGKSKYFLLPTPMLWAGFKPHLRTWLSVCGCSCVDVDWPHTSNVPCQTRSSSYHCELEQKGLESFAITLSDAITVWLKHMSYLDVEGCVSSDNSEY